MGKSSAVPARVSSVSAWLIFAALFLSGLAAIVNQSVWQRALKVYLAGCESASSMIVVLAFMGGLGAGSLAMGLAAHRLRNPLRLLAFVELGLCAVNLLIAGMLASDISETIYSFQRMAVSLGVPLRLVYGVTAVGVLLLPCFLMGVTMPLVSEVSQRQLHCTTNRFVTTLFVLNTLGSVLGGVVGGFLLMPYCGQLVALAVGASCNCVAGSVFLGLYAVKYRGTAMAATESLRFRFGRLAPAEIMGFWLGFLSLGYEMYIFRLAALAHQPLPYNFSLVLCYYLLFWSLGVFFATRIKTAVPTLLVISGLLVAAMPVFFLFDRSYLHPTLARVLPAGWLPLSISALVYCVPCVPFGCLFGQVLSGFAKNWGNDVGRYYGLNTLGSCLGIVAMTFGGFEVHHIYAVACVALGYLGLFFYSRKRMPSDSLPAPERRLTRLALLGLGLCLVVLLPARLMRESRDFPRYRAYYGKDGVIEVAATGELLWDGLWHSSLAVDGNHVGTNNWRLAAIPVLCYSGPAPDDTLVVGLGTGITAATLALSDRVKSVDVYEIDHKLQTVLCDYPDGTLHVAENPKVHVIWQDGRAGLALNDKRYDLITQQPLYLKQAGSSILLSREYMQMVQRRLKPQGVFCIYCNAEGHAEQALLVRQTAASVFRHCVSFGRGYMIIASDSPVVYHTQWLADAQDRDPLLQEARSLTLASMQAYLDEPRLNWSGGPYLVTDNHPLVEYPGVVRALLAPQQTVGVAPVRP